MLRSLIHASEFSILNSSLMWNPFKKKNKNDEEKETDFSNLPGVSDPKDLNMFQRFAMRRLAKMSPAEREKVMRKAMTPKNVQKHKGEILTQLENMRKAGQISDDQYRLSRKKLGI